LSKLLNYSSVRYSRVHLSKPLNYLSVSVFKCSLIQASQLSERSLRCPVLDILSVFGLLFPIAGIPYPDMKTWRSFLVHSSPLTNPPSISIAIATLKSLPDRILKELLHSSSLMNPHSIFLYSYSLLISRGFSVASSLGLWLVLKTAKLHPSTRSLGANSGRDV
jgi:hypothetical protein